MVVYLADDLSAADLSLYQPNRLPAPHLQHLANQGLIFDHAFVASPSCAPSRAALMTGLMPAKNGAELNHTYPHSGVPRLSNQLRELGYEVLVFGKVIHGKYRDTAAYQFDHFDPRPVNLPAHLETYFKQHQPQKPVCLLIGDRRPHVPWTKELLFHPDSL
ncbi:MAG: sulfatase-like hydrolase/transferase, partial [Bacteroidota bacterium]